MASSNFTCPKCSSQFESERKLQTHKLAAGHTLKALKLTAEIAEPAQAQDRPQNPSGDAPSQAQTSNGVSNLPKKTSFACAGCTKKFTSASALQNHQSSKQHGPSNLKDKPEHSCRTCQKNFKSAQALKDHQGTVKHGSFGSGMELQHECRTCQKKLKSAEALKNHQESTKHGTFSGGDEHQHECRICQRQFKSAEGLRDHQTSTKHDSPYRCEECSESFKKEQHLNAHMASIRHHPIGTFTCGCGHVFPCPSALLQHLESDGCPDADMRRRFDGMIHEQSMSKGKNISALKGITQLLRWLAIKDGQRQEGKNCMEEEDELLSEDGSRNGVTVASDDSSNSWEKVDTPQEGSDLIQ